MGAQLRCRGGACAGRRRDATRGDPADVRAHTVYLVQIGYISMQVQEDLETRIGRIPAYIKTFTGTAPSDEEMRRFRARHGYLPR